MWLQGWFSSKLLSSILSFTHYRGATQTSLCRIYRLDLHTAGYYKRLFRRTFPEAIPFVCSCLSPLTGLQLVKFSQPILIKSSKYVWFTACCCHGNQLWSMLMRFACNWASAFEAAIPSLSTENKLYWHFNLWVCSLAQAFSILYPLYHSWHLLFPQACLLVSLEGDIVPIRSLILQRDSNKLKLFLMFPAKKR